MLSKEWRTGHACHARFPCPHLTNHPACPQYVNNEQCQAAVESARAAASHLQPGIRDALVDLKLRNNYQFDSDLVRDCNVEEHRALHCDIEVRPIVCV